MRIRAITIGQNFPIFYEFLETEAFLEEKLEKFKPFFNGLIEEFKRINLPVETKRICSQPLLMYESQLTYRKDVQETLSLLHEEFSILQKLFKKYGIDYFACSTMLADELGHFGIFEKLILDEFDKYLKEFPSLFTSIPVISENKISFPALKSAAKIIKKLSEPDPFKNLQFCVSCNVPPNTPFFPAAYHSNSDKPAFSIALEMADEIISIFNKASNLKEAKFNLEKRFDEIYEEVLKISERISYKYNLEFKGMDFAPAPFPRFDRSIGTAIESFGIEYFGGHGSLFAIALIANSIPKKEKVIGFSGVMLPVLEDFTLSLRLKEKKFTIDTLLLYSTVCGTGLDCVPLPGSITERELFYILLDLSTISIAHHKPLTARLMPIPGKEAGDDVKFDFEYFSPSKVMDIKRLSDSKKNDIFKRNEDIFNFL
ncbi:MAG: DUF711 family protein [Promethearchaeota archaeon]